MRGFAHLVEPYPRLLRFRQRKLRPALALGPVRVRLYLRVHALDLFPHQLRRLRLLRLVHAGDVVHLGIQLLHGGLVRLHLVHRHAQQRKVVHAPPKADVALQHRREVRVAEPRELAVVGRDDGGGALDSQAKEAHLAKEAPLRQELDRLGRCAHEGLAASLFQDEEVAVRVALLDDDFPLPGAEGLHAVADLDQRLVVAGPEQRHLEERLGVAKRHHLPSQPRRKLVEHVIIKKAPLLETILVELCDALFQLLLGAEKSEQRVHTAQLVLVLPVVLRDPGERVREDRDHDRPDEAACDHHDHRVDLFAGGARRDVAIPHGRHRHDREVQRLDVHVEFGDALGVEALLVHVEHPVLIGLPEDVVLVFASADIHGERGLAARVV